MKESQPGESHEHTPHVPEIAISARDIEDVLDQYQTVGQMHEVPTAVPPVEKVVHEECDEHTPSLVPEVHRESHSGFQREYAGVTIEFSRPEDEVRRSVREYSSLADTALRMLPRSWRAAQTLRQSRVERAFGGYGVTVRIVGPGILRVADGHTRLYEAIEAGVLPERIPVTIPGETYLHVTLRDAIERAKSVPVRE